MNKIELTGEETNVDLQTMCDEFSVTVEAKNPKKPNKTELITAIEKYNGVESIEDATEVDSEGVDNEMSEEEYAELTKVADVVTEAEPVVKKKKRMTKKEMGQLLNPLRRVQITYNDDTQTKRDVVFITWGNDVIGHQTDRLLIGRPWHIREGALRNLRDNIISKSVPNPETGNPEYVEMPAYNIIELPMLKLEEYRELGRKQEVRNAAIEGVA